MNNTLFKWRHFNDKGDRESASEEISINCTGEGSTTMLFCDNPHGRRQRCDYYLIYLLRGEVKLCVENEHSSFSPGEVVIIPPHTQYRYDNVTPGEEVSYLYLHFTGSKCKELIASCGISPSKPVKIGIQSDIIEKFEELFDEFINRHKSFSFATSALTKQILILIGKRAEMLAGAQKRNLTRSIRYIHSHLNESLEVKDLAKMEYISPSRYRQIFHEVMGKSPIEYITLQHILLARNLIERGYTSISQIAEECGYSDRFYFQRVFKKIMGVTPGKYRTKFL